MSDINTKMVRVAFILEPEQIEYIKQLAKERQINPKHGASTVVRQIIEEHRTASPIKNPWATTDR